ncbi:MAG: peptide transporter, partial [bacterium]
SMPFSGLLWNQYFIRSAAASAAGIAEDLPRWFAPQPDHASYRLHSFFHVEWLPVIAMGIFGTFFGGLANMILGYGLFRVTSDIERLPFPMAPVGAQGILAVAEDSAAKVTKNAEAFWRWRVFSIGGAIGLVFGAVYLLLPILSGTMTGTAIQIFPIPFADFTGTTGQYLPAIATGLSWDFGNLLMGMVMPFFGMLGAFIGMVSTLIANPLLYRLGILHSWKMGDDTIATLFKNNIDFYFSFGIGIGLTIALVGIYQVVKGFHNARTAKAALAPANGGRKAPGFTPPAGRGDIPGWAMGVCYVFVTTTYIVVSILLLLWHHNWVWSTGIRNIAIVLGILGFIYTPVLSYMTARMEGMVGQAVTVPFVLEAGLILSGYRGVACWFLPVPVANYGSMAGFYRQCELTGTKFTSIWKSQLVLYPIILISSIFFMNFLWGMGDIPSGVYPFAQKMWPLQAANNCVMYTATLGEYSIFEQAFNWIYLVFGSGFALSLFIILGKFGAPIMLVYGVIGSVGTAMPHAIIPQFIGAMIGRYYFQKRLGLRWRQYIPVVTAGFACGMGLIGTVGVGITFLSTSIIKLPF